MKAPETTETPAPETPAPAASPLPSQAEPYRETPLFHVVDARPPRPSRWRYVEATAAAICRQVYPLAALGGGVFLFEKFGPTGWLWLVLGFVLVAFMFGPKNRPAA